MFCGCLEIRMKAALQHRSGSNNLGDLKEMKVLGGAAWLRVTITYTNIVFGWVCRQPICFGRSGQERTVPSLILQDYGISSPETSCKCWLNKRYTASLLVCVWSRNNREEDDSMTPWLDIMRYIVCAGYANVHTNRFNSYFYPSCL